MFPQRGYMKDNNHIQSTLLRLAGKRSAFNKRLLNMTDVNLKLKVKDRVDDITLEIVRLNAILKLQSIRS